jgi:gamma-glutamyl hydrolase
MRRFMKCALRRFGIVNGFLIPGGSAPLRPGHSFFDAATEVVHLADKANQAGDRFPILAICLGFETLAVIASGNTSILGRCGQPGLPDTAPKSPLSLVLALKMVRDNGRVI